jgi:NADH dehydrogenase
MWRSRQDELVLQPPGPIARRRVWTINGTLPKFAYLSLHLMHRATLIGWRRAFTLMLADGLQRTVAPPLKLH